ncbi:MAG: hypothetical protein IJ604_05235 [Prevotella sp.]|nr:hypothetical protein [Prevotella sp.]MBR1462767.1 hypothetical protein [Prevotella sp.]
MEIKFDELQQRVRSIRRNTHRNSTYKVDDVLRLAIDYNYEKSQDIWREIVLVLAPRYRVEPITEHAVRSFINWGVPFAHFLLLTVEAWADNNKAWVMSDVVTIAKQFILERDPGDAYIFKYPSYNGLWVEYQEGEGPDTTVLLPQELKEYNNNYLVLRVIGMNRLIETCSDPQPIRARPFDILNRLDREVINGMPGGVFPAHTVIFCDNDEHGFIFEFSHFEVDLQEPDPKFRTLYVVYRYDTIVS